MTTFCNRSETRGKFWIKAGSIRSMVILPSIDSLSCAVTKARSSARLLLTYHAMKK